MHGLVNRSIQCFLRDTYGADAWAAITRDAALPAEGFETMLGYDDALTEAMLVIATRHLNRPRETILEDTGTYLVSHPNTESLRRLLRFGGVTFTDFLHSLEELPGRARLAVPELHLPTLDLTEIAADMFRLRVGAALPGFGLALVGVLRAMADDYGALVVLDHEMAADGEVVTIRLLDHSFAEGRHFELASPGGQG